jgi:predicted nucleotidyltransferase
MGAIEVLTEIYLNPGIHVREISRRTGLGIPSVKNQLNKLLKENLVSKKFEGRNLKFFLNMKNSYTIPYLYQIEYLRLKKLPRTVKDMVFDFLSTLEKKPVMTLIFGSFAKGSYAKTSDLDLLLVLNEIEEKELESKSKLVSGRYSLNLEPVYISWKEFREKFFDEKDSFIKEIKTSKIIVSGIEHWVMLENEKA